MKEETLPLGRTGIRRIQNLLRDAGILLGIRADKGICRLAGDVVEYSTHGLKDLEINLKRYKSWGATFTLYRCVYRISDITPTTLALEVNSQALARFAAISQREGLVPIVSPEFYPAGEHDDDELQVVLKKILAALVKALHDYHVYWEGLMVRVNGVVPSPLYCGPCDFRRIAQKTLQVVNGVLPPALGGVLLARSTSLVSSINILSELNKCPIKKAHLFSFCYSQVIQDGIMRIWGGCDENLARAQEELIRRAKLCSLGSVGQYPEANGSLFVSNITRF